MDIEKGSNLGAHDIGRVTTTKSITPYLRKEEGEQETNNTWGAHTSHS